MNKNDLLNRLLEELEDRIVAIWGCLPEADRAAMTPLSPDKAYSWYQGKARKPGMVKTADWARTGSIVSDIRRVKISLNYIEKKREHLTLINCESDSIRALRANMRRSTKRELQSKDEIKHTISQGIRG